MKPSRWPTSSNRWTGRSHHARCPHRLCAFDDRFAKRKILVGVAQANTSVNNYLDGPFDQLPDNFIEGDVLKDAILAATPEMAGQIDRLGNSPDGQTRYLIAPYMNFEDPSELEMIAQCGADEDLPVYYNCFSFADTGGAPEDGECARRRRRAAGGWRPAAIGWLKQCTKRKRPPEGGRFQSEHPLRAITLGELERTTGLGAAYFLRSTTRLSRVRKPPFFRTGRRPGSKYVSALDRP